MKANEVLKILQITRPTLTKYIKIGLVKIDSQINNRYVYNDESVFALIGKNQKENRITVSYSRVSTQTQKQQLKDQTQRIYNSCISRGIILDKQFEEIGSGMNSQRIHFQEIIRQIIKGKIKLVVIENKDRLIRFNFELLEQIFIYFGTKILILNDILENRTYEQELTEDLISVIHYFTMKSYSHRRKLNKLRKELETSNTEE